MPAKFKTPAEYLKSLPKEKQAVLKKLHEVLSKALPKAEEVISYSMPAFKQSGIVVWYAASKNNYAVYVYPRILAMFQEELSEYSGTKSAIHFAFDKPIPA